MIATPARLWQLLALILIALVETHATTAHAGKVPPFAGVTEPIETRVGQAATLSVTSLKTQYTGHAATSTQFRSCVKVEVAVLGSPS